MFTLSQGLCDKCEVDEADEQQKFKTRYATLGFSDKASLDEGLMWPTAFALEELTAAEEAIRELWLVSSRPDIQFAQFSCTRLLAQRRNPSLSVVPTQ